MEQVFVVVVCDTVAVKPSAVTAIVGPTTPVVVAYAVPRLLVYFTESAKYASSAVIKLRRSDFIEARYAFSFVFANFGIAIAARMPMITTTIRSSINVKPLRFILVHSFVFSIWDTVRGAPLDPLRERSVTTKTKCGGDHPPPHSCFRPVALNALPLAFLCCRGQPRRTHAQHARLGR